LHARQLAEGSISVFEQRLGITTFGELAIGDWFKNVHSWTLYRKESENSVHAHNQLDEPPYSQSFRMGEDDLARVVRRQEQKPQ